MRKLLLSLIVILSTATASAQPTTRPSTQPAALPLRFGVFAQHSRDLEKWAKRGVDTAIGHQLVGRNTDPQDVQDADLPLWETKAFDLGLKIIGKADPARIAQQVAQSHRLAFGLPDEPDMNDRPNGGNPGNVRHTPEQVKAMADAIRAVGGMAFCNFAGPKFDNDFYPGDKPPNHKAYFAAPDVLGADYYFVGTGRPPGPRGTMPLTPTGFSFIYEKIMDRLHHWGGGKPFWLFVESGPLNISGANRPGPTLAQFRYQVLHIVCYAKANGYNLAGICIFPVRERPWEPDATPPEIAAAMPEIFAEAKRIWSGESPAKLPLELQNALDFQSVKLADLGRMVRDVRAALDRPLTLTPTTKPSNP